MPIDFSGPADANRARVSSRSSEEAKIVNVLDSYWREARAMEGSAIVKQREKAQRRYFGQSQDRKKLQDAGRSAHVSRDVFDAVETQKAYLLEAFAANRNVCRFMPSSPELTQLADAATRYVNDKFYQHESEGGCGGYQVLRDIIHDGLVTKIGVYYCDWDESLEPQQIDLEGVPLQQLQTVMATAQAQGMNPEVAYAEITQTQMGPMVEAQVDLRMPRNRVELRSVPPERFKADPQADSLADAVYCVEEIETTISEMLDMGFDPDIVMDTPEQWRNPETEYEDYARHTNDASWASNYTGVRSEDQERRVLYHWVARMNFDAILERDGSYRDDPRPGDLYEIYECGGRIMQEPRKIKRNPYGVWSPYQISHRWMGMSTADVVGDLQDTRSITIRSVIDNQMINNTSRFAAVKELIANPRALTDNRIGGVIWQKQPNAIQPVPSAPLSPETFSLNEELKQEREARTGNARVASGLNQDAVSKQNAESLIENYASRSERRQMMMARDFAYDVLKPLMATIFELHIEHSQGGMVPLTHQGQTVQVPVQQLQQLGSLSVRVALTPDEGRMQAEKLMALDMTWKQDEQLSSMYGPRQRFQLWSDVIDYLDIPSGTEYLLSPDSPEYQQMMEAQAQEAQMAQQAQMVTAQAQLALMQAQAEGIQQQSYMKAREIAHKMAQDELGMHLKVEDQTHDHNIENQEIAIDWQELGIEKKQERAVSVG